MRPLHGSRQDRTKTKSLALVHNDEDSATKPPHGSRQNIRKWWMQNVPHEDWQAIMHAMKEQADFAQMSDLLQMQAS